MAGDWFFLSYARLDRDTDPFECIKRFYEDLDRAIRRKKVIKAGTAGFFDGTGIQAGDQWPQALASALSNCRVLVCLYSSAYFNSEYCGKELAVFNSRIDNYLNAAPANTTLPRLILPVLLDPPHGLGNIPEPLSDTQYVDDGYPEIYREEGLAYLLKRNKPELKDAYQDFLDEVEKKLLTMSALTLPSLQSLPDIKTVQSAFARPTVSNGSAGAASTSSDDSGPRYADFIYVAGKSEEIQPLGRSVANYGTEGELDWKPYLPDSPDEIGLLAQSAATREGFRYQRMPLDANLLNLIRDAENKNRIVILIVDTWTLRVQKYKQWMEDYDRLNFANCAALIVWNDKDLDTTRERAALIYTVQQTFLHKTRVKDPSLIDNITSPTHLTNTLGATLQKVKAQVIDTNKLRRIDPARLVNKPEIVGPGTTN
jgi:FxsC-like protein